MQRTILHVDFNNFYASIEELYHPELRGKPMIVTGDPALRHGIVLSKNNEAKAFGIRTAETIAQAKAKCPDLAMVTADMGRYGKYADGLLDLCMGYTDLIESGGDDEAYLDVTGSALLFGDGATIADALRRRSIEEFNITCSVGVSFCKIFAKLGSDMKKPNATTVISRENFREKVWRLPASDLLYIGRATAARLDRYGIHTIGDVANADRSLLCAILGKCGNDLWMAANGCENAPVACITDEVPIKSVGTSSTAPRDLTNREEVLTEFMALAESVAARLRKRGLKCRTVHIGVRGNDLAWSGHQATLRKPTQISDDLISEAMRLFDRHYTWARPIRSLGLHCSNLIDIRRNVQLSFLGNDAAEERALRLESAKDDIRRRFGPASILRASLLADRALCGIAFKTDRRGALGAL